MEVYKKFLADSILAEDKVITYRLLSRALKVHVNIAKQMLYEFHKFQNDRRPGAVHATYLIYGTRKFSETQALARIEEDGDVKMASSAPQIEIELHDESATPALTLFLVQEEKLDAVLADYEQVLSIHVYSVGPHPANDLMLLSDAARQDLELFSGEDSVDARKVYGTILNPDARRRDRQKAGAWTSLDAVKAIKDISKPASAAAPKVKEEPKEEPKTYVSNVQKEATLPAPAKKVPSLRRGGSGIIQAFSKAAAAKEKRADASQTATPSGDDSGVHPMSDDGEDDSEISQPKAHQGGTHKSRKEREEELRRMMEEDEDEEEEEEDDDDDDEEEEEEVVVVVEKEEEEEEEEEGEGEKEKKEKEGGEQKRIDTPAEGSSEESPDSKPAKEDEPSEIVSASANGRRRGKRRIMKKKQVMDDQGYLVTIQEQAWESFSEDEAPPPSKEKPASTAPAAPATAKPKKGVAKGGSQGNIMSFFNKK